MLYFFISFFSFPAKIKSVINKKFISLKILPRFWKRLHLLIIKSFDILKIYMVILDLNKAILISEIEKAKAQSNGKKETKSIF